MATTSNAAMRKKTPFYVSIFLIHDTSGMQFSASSHLILVLGNQISLIVWGIQN
jgi:hypothetical protein